MALRTGPSFVSGDGGQPGHSRSRGQGAAAGPGEPGVRGGGRTDQLDSFVARCAAVQLVEEPFAVAEQDGGDDQAQGVDEPGTKVLLDGGSTTVDVLPAGGGKGALVECRAQPKPVRRPSPHRPSAARRLEPKQPSRASASTSTEAFVTRSSGWNEPRGSDQVFEGRCKWCRAGRGSAGAIFLSPTGLLNDVVGCRAEDHQVVDHRGRVTGPVKSG